MSRYYTEYMWEYLDGKSVLVTGGTGSFGQACIRYLLEKTSARRVIVFSRDELKQALMNSALSFHDERLRFFLGDVRDLERLKSAFRGVDYVIHAAALKQVPMLEYNPFEAVKTNILGTQNVIEAAIEKGVAKTLLISTDKAANPANLYGATKLCAEKLMISGNFYAGNQPSCFAVVRYGNVLGSRGSLVHIVKEQRVSGEITLTHEEMTRFWITLNQGIELVLNSMAMMHGGETFVPKIPSMRVKDVIMSLAPECKHRIVGIRPGEKLHEVLVTTEEARRTKEFADYYVILPDHKWWENNNYVHGQSLPENYKYSSDGNTDMLDEGRLKEMIQGLL